MATLRCCHKELNRFAHIALHALACIEHHRLLVKCRSLLRALLWRHISGLLRLAEPVASFLVTLVDAKAVLVRVAEAVHAVGVPRLRCTAQVLARLCLILLDSRGALHQDLAIGRRCLGIPKLRRFLPQFRGPHRVLFAA